VKFSFTLDEVKAEDLLSYGKIFSPFLPKPPEKPETKPK